MSPVELRCSDNRFNHPLSSPNAAGQTPTATPDTTLESATAITSKVASQLPASSNWEVAPRNYIDDFIFDKIRASKIPHAGLSSDSEFLRRVYFDLWGRLPDPEEVRTFLADSNPEKRDKLIDRLLGLDYKQKPGNDDYKGPWLVEEPFLSKWSYWFGDLFRMVHKASKDATLSGNTSISS